MREEEKAGDYVLIHYDRWGRECFWVFCTDDEYVVTESDSVWELSRRGTPYYAGMREWCPLDPCQVCGRLGGRGNWEHYHSQSADLRHAEGRDDGFYDGFFCPPCWKERGEVLQKEIAALENRYLLNQLKRVIYEQKRDTNRRHSDDRRTEEVPCGSAPSST